MNDTPIAEVPNHKHLGLNISKDGTHHTHIDLITEKTYRRLNILRRFKFILDRKTLETIYLTQGRIQGEGGAHPARPPPPLKLEKI